jgi:hypothetical protein
MGVFCRAAASFNKAIKCVPALRASTGQPNQLFGRHLPRVMRHPDTCEGECSSVPFI